jgi:hypothetical protein
MKLLLGFLGASALVAGVILYLDRQPADTSSYQASILDVAKADVEGEPQSAEESPGEEPGVSEGSSEVSPEPQVAEPASPAPTPESIPVAIAPAPVAPAPPPAFINIPSLSGGSSAPPPAPAPVAVTQPEAYLEISVETVSSTTSTPAAAFICTPEDLHLVISELFIDMIGPDTQEFIKLYNPGAQEVSLASSSLQYLSGTASGIDKAAKKNFPAGAKVASQGSYLIGMGDYAGPTADMTWSQALSNTGAAVFLVRNATLISGIDDPDIIDRVAYGTGTMLMAIGAPALLPPAGEHLIIIHE